MTLRLPPLALITLPCLKDNYAYLLHDAATDTTAVVDVPDALPVLDALAVRGWKLNHILITHHHDDHIAGVEALAQATGARVYGAAADAHRLPPLDEALAPGDRFPIGLRSVEVLDAPGHTLGHIAFHLTEDTAADTPAEDEETDGSGADGPGWLFSGDSLMSWGCGRLFEGAPAQMFQTLTRMAALPPQTLVCSGHEYTEANGRFALSLEPDHPALHARMQRVRELRAAGRPSLPVTLAEELATNPFLRGADPALCAALGLPAGTDAQAVFTEARARKDRF